MLSSPCDQATKHSWLGPRAQVCHLISITCSNPTYKACCRWVESSDSKPLPPPNASSRKRRMGELWVPLAILCGWRFQKKGLGRLEHCWISKISRWWAESHFAGLADFLTQPEQRPRPCPSASFSWASWPLAISGTMLGTEWTGKWSANGKLAES
jgi:hypothetical protein